MTMTLDPRALRDAFGAFATGVTVVTCIGPDGRPLGFTANSFSSVSLDPPLLLVCLSRNSANHAVFCAADRFAVNVLSEGQSDLSNTFARPAADRFAGVEWRPGNGGVPLLGGVSAWFDCAAHEVLDGGDHSILLGRVEACEATPMPGLGYVRGAYFTPLREAGVLEDADGARVSVLVEYRGRVWLPDGGSGRPGLPTRGAGGGIGAAVERLLDGCPVAARPGFIYSVFDDDRGRHRMVFLCSATDEPPGGSAFRVLDDGALAAIEDEAVRSVLERFALESALGNFGIYYGNRSGGEVRRVQQSAV